jgi:hypothetical protein
MFDIRSMYRRILTQLKVPNLEEILPNPMGAKESNPALENVSMTMGRPAAAYPDQDHLAHIKIHLEYAQNPAYGGNPVIGPVFAPHALEHIKQHLTLHYLQSMRQYVAQAAGGQDTLDLHQEKPLDQDSQQALALASHMVTMDSQQTMAPYTQQIQQLAQKVQQAQQAQQQNIASQDPTAQVILKTQMAETERKQKESEARMQIEVARDKQNYDLKIAELQRQVLELQGRYETQTTIDNQKNATQIAIADINNSSRERIAEIAANAQLTSDQLSVQHEQDMLARQATIEAQQSLQNHGIEIEQQQVDHMAQIAQQAQQAAHAQDQAQQQAGLDAALQQQQAQLQPPTPPTQGQ